MMKIFHRRILGIVLRAIISFGILIFLFFRIKLKSFLDIINTADLGILLFAFFLFLVSNILCFVRWQMILKGLKINFYPLILLSSFSGGLFFNLFFPSTIGGDFLRITDLSLRTQKTKEVFSSVILDRLSGYLALDFIIIFALLFGHRIILDKKIFFIVIGFSILLITLLFILFNNFLYTKLSNFLSLFKNRFFSILVDVHNCIYQFRYQKAIILKSFFVSLLSQLIGIGVAFMVALSLNKLINIGYFFLFVPLIGAITTLPVSIGGLGLREALFIFFFGSIGLSRDFCLALSLLNFVFILIISSLGGIIYAFTLHLGRIQHH